jgi:hypothetical protein
MNRAEFRQFVIDIYVDTLGIAAEFVVDDAFAVLDQHPEWRAHPQLMRAQLLIALEKQTPPEVPLAAMRSSIVENLKLADLTQ